MKEFIADFIKKHAVEINTENFLKVYGDAYIIFSKKQEVEDIGLLTEIFEEAGIKPLSHLSLVPFCYKAYSDIDEFIVPDNIKAIMEQAFCNCYYLERLKLPRSVKMIDRNAFIGCKALQYIQYDGEPTDFLAIQYHNLKECCHPDLQVLCSDGTVLKLSDIFMA